MKIKKIIKILFIICFILAIIFYLIYIGIAGYYKKVKLPIEGEYEFFLDSLGIPWKDGIIYYDKSNIDQLNDKANNNYYKLNIIFFIFLIIGTSLQYYFIYKKKN